MITDQQKREWLYNLSNLPTRHWPFDHAILQNTIPADLYADMLDNMPPHEEFVPLHSTGRIGKGAYPCRYIFPCEWMDIRSDAHRQQLEFWGAIFKFIHTSDFALALARPFGKLAKQLEANPQAWAMDTLLIEDLPGYRIGPHADANHKVLSALFYINKSMDWPAWGTSIYAPKEPADVDPQSGRHYEFEQFDRIATVNYARNSGLMFVKSDTSWHGVEQIPAIEGERRVVLLADIKLRR